MFETQLKDAEAKAFENLMRFLSSVDSSGTVIMVQVENECGILGDSRDGCPAADRAFASPVPKNLLDSLRTNWDTLHPSLRQNLDEQSVLDSNAASKSWREVFGTTSKTDELFMAYHYAKHVDTIAAVGKAAHPVPLYTNVWQNYGAEDRDTSFPAVVGGGSDPGIYPSGGGVIDVLDIWQMHAPSLDMISPDVYLNEYGSSCAKYRHRNQPLFIPEQRRDEYGARRAWQAIGTYQALGVSPFGMDTVEVEYGVNPFAKHYDLMKQCSKHILDAQQRPGASYGFYFDDMRADGTAPDSCPQTWSFDFDDWSLRIERSFVFGTPSAGYGMVIQLEPGTPRFLLVGRGFQVIFTSRRADAIFSGILSFKEKEVVDETTGELRTVRWLNGDETRSGQFAIMPSEDPDYGGFPISITVPSGTAIAEVEPYALFQ